MTSSAIMKNNMKFVLTNSKDRKIDDYNADKYYPKRLEKDSSILKQYSYGEKKYRMNNYFFFDEYKKDKENIYDPSLSKLLHDSISKEFTVFESALVHDSISKEFTVFESALVDDSISKEFTVFESALVDDKAIKEKYVLSEIIRIVDETNKKIENMNNKIITLKKKIEELK